MKIYQRAKQGYAVFEVADYSKGTRRLCSFSDHDEAVAEAKRISWLMAAGETTAAQIRNPQAASYGRAVELLRPTGVALEIAARHFAEEMLAFKAARGASAAYARDLNFRLNKIFAAFPTLIANVTTADVQRWLDGVKGSSRTALNFRRVISTLFAFAEARG